MKNFLIVLVAVACYHCSTKSSENLIYQRLAKCNSENSGGLDSTVLCGTLSVFENRQTNTGRKIDLNIVVIPAIHKDPSASPIFFFEGGPGVAATAIGNASFFADSINYYRLNYDIVLIDARGTGRSNPLHCSQTEFKKDLAAQFQEMYPVDAVKDCYDSLSKFADLTQYTTTNIASDIEEVRQWLGYDKINLYGVSYGTRLAQVYMKMFPKSVESCVLWSPTTTYTRMPLYHAQFAEEALGKLYADCAGDSLCRSSFPNFKQEFTSVIKQGKEKAFHFNRALPDGKIEEIEIPWRAVQTKLRSFMYSPMGLRQIPFIVHHAYQGNWAPFLSLFPDHPVSDDFIADGMYLCITCTEDVPFFSGKEADSLSRNTFMGDYRTVQQKNGCSVWAKGTVPDQFFEPLISDIPTLIISGYLDPVTPPSMAEQIVSTLSHGHLISIPTMSHGFEGLRSPECFDKIVIDFLNEPLIRPASACASDMLPLPYKVVE